MRRTTLVAAAACAALTLAGCAEASPAVPPAAGSTAAASASRPAGTGAPAAVGTFRACHKHRDGSLVLILLFANRDRSLIGGFEGALGYLVDAVDPATWTTGEAVEVEPGYNDHVRQITVPVGEDAPSEITLSVTTTAAVDETNVLATNEVTVPVPAAACSTA